MKRSIDIVLALALSLPALLVTLLAAVLVKIDSSGPAFLLQERVGRDRKPFRIIKLRTMAEDTPTGPSHIVGQATITRVGRILRRSKIDELPQIWSVLTGTMSFVGPRPCLPTQTELICTRERLGVFLVRPGITGLAQVTGIDMSEPQRLAEVDAKYVREQNVWIDLRLISRTVMGGTIYDAADGGAR